MARASRVLDRCAVTRGCAPMLRSVASRQRSLCDLRLRFARSPTGWAPTGVLQGAVVGTRLAREAFARLFAGRPAPTEPLAFVGAHPVGDRQCGGWVDHRAFAGAHPVGDRPSGGWVDHRAFTGAHPVGDRPSGGWVDHRAFVGAHPVGDRQCGGWVDHRAFAGAHPVGDCCGPYAPDPSARNAA
jgi:hypothetical protein